ncbi:MAG: glycosyltransferase family 2 protein [Amphiplicatus sp.]
MTALLDLAFLVPAFAVFVLAGFFALEIAGAFLRARSLSADAKEAGPIAVIIPAHDEEASIAATLAGVKAQLRPGDRLIVVADNCTDATADIAAAAGAEALVRIDPDRRGKGYALQFALEALREAPPSVIVFIDADCRLEADALASVAGAAEATGRPAQALYLMRAPESAGPQRKVSAFAWLLMNEVRMGGLFTLFDVCRLTGSGMALPWDIAKDLDLASGEIVEDLALSARLAETAAPVFVRDALVTSDFPSAEESAAKQHARWEHGSLRLALRRAPSMLGRGFARGDLRLVAAALDLAIPPLTVFAALILAVSAACLVPLLWGSTAPLALSLSALALLLAATFAAWARFGRGALPASALGAAGLYILGKLRIYGREGRASSQRWTRTKRDAER